MDIVAPLASSPVLPAEARAIARDACVYGYPMVANYRFLHAWFVEDDGPEYKGPWNIVHSGDTTAAGTDMLCSYVGADLRAEPLVLTLPEAEGRYRSLQFIDLYSHNFAYAGTRLSGDGAVRYLLAGPRWVGAVPPGIDAVIRSETELALIIYRTQLFGLADLHAARTVQMDYRAEPLSRFLGRTVRAFAPAIDFPAPLTRESERTSLRFFDLLNFLLGFCPTHPSERNLMERFSRLGFGPGQDFDLKVLAPELRVSLMEGVSAAWKACETLKPLTSSGELTGADLYGSREFLKNNYLRRMIAAASGLYGNSREELLYPGYLSDAAGEPLDGSHHTYTLTFPEGRLPPAGAFWSLALYSLSDLQPAANPLGRHLVNTAMLPHLKRDGDGGITLHIQSSSPGSERESNWLPAPCGRFLMMLRIYSPKPEAFDGSWAKPPLIKTQRP